jgi:hypothetical protein
VETISSLAPKDLVLFFGSTLYLKNFHLKAVEGKHFIKKLDLIGHFAKYRE